MRQAERKSAVAVGFFRLFHQIVCVAAFAAEWEINMKKKIFAVFGLGRYGAALAKELVANGVEVIAVDIDEDAVNDLAGEVPICKCADVTDPEAIRQLGVSSVDTVILAMSGHLEASVMATLLCKDAGVETVIAKCASQMHCRILKRVGADNVLIPEVDSGVRLAKRLVSSGVIDIIELSKRCSLAEMDVRPEWVGKSLVELALRRKYGINIAALKTGEEVSMDVDPQKPLERSMKLIVIADNAKLEKLIK